MLYIYLINYRYKIKFYVFFFICFIRDVMYVVENNLIVLLFFFYGRLVDYIVWYDWVCDLVMNEMNLIYM